MPKSAMTPEMEEWLSRQHIPEKKKSKKTQHQEGKSQKVEQGEWINHAIEMVDTALEYADELQCEDWIVQALLERREVLVNLPENTNPPDYDSFFYTIDVTQLFRITFDIDQYESLEREIRGQSHLFPYLRGMTIGGVSEAICNTIIRCYTAWARKTVQELGPKYLEITE